jgi:hypothetical protein
MTMRGKTLCVLAMVLLLAGGTRAGVIFSDDFESGELADWATVPAVFTAGTALDISTAQNKEPVGGQYSALLNIGSDGMYRSVPQIGSTAHAATFSYYLYDGSATRAWGEVRTYSTGTFSGSLQQLFAAGKYTLTSYPGDPYNATKYQGRLTAGSPTGWFNLTDGPDRSPGWHRFDVERQADGSTIKWYVDGIVARTITGAAQADWNTVVITSVRGSSTVAGDAYFDGVIITDSLVPEPGTFSVLALGALGLLARRRA